MSLPAGVVIPSTILENLKCVNCSLYLSVPPIMYNHQQNLVCGRCKDPAGKLLIRAKAFESVAKLLLFPCRYATKGCANELSWEFVENHEISCDFRDYNCPSVANCKWQGNSKMFLEHFKTTHEHLILNLNHFHLDLQMNLREIRLMSVWTRVFLLEFMTDLDESKVRFGVAYIDSQQPEETAHFTYKLELKHPDDDNAIKFSHNVKTNREWKFDKSEMLEISIDSIQNILSTSKVICKINISEIVKPKKDDKGTAQAQEETQKDSSAPSSSEVNPSIDKDLLSELECPVCNEYMIPPIFLCHYGHSICGNCKLKASSCPNCKASLGHTRNFALEKLTNCINYPCKNETFGCKFVGNSNIISDHNQNCTLKSIDCPLKDFARCTWAGSINNLSTHVEGKHLQNAWMVVNQSFYRDLSHAIFSDCNIMVHEGNFFKICCKHSRKATGSVSWAFQHVGLRPNQDSPYKFEIEFLDQTNTGRKFIIDALCVRVTDDTDAFRNCLTISYDLLRPFINSNKYLIFKYDIQRK